MALSLVQGEHGGGHSVVNDVDSKILPTYEVREMRWPWLLGRPRKKPRRCFGLQGVGEPRVELDSCFQGVCVNCMSDPSFLGWDMRSVSPVRGATRAAVTTGLVN